MSRTSSARELTATSKISLDLTFPSLLSFFNLRRGELVEISPVDNVFVIGEEL